MNAEQEIKELKARMSRYELLSKITKPIKKKDMRKKKAILQGINFKNKLLKRK